MTILENQQENIAIYSAAQLGGGWASQAQPPSLSVWPSTWSTEPRWVSRLWRRPAAVPEAAARSSSASRPSKKAAGKDDTPVLPSEPAILCCSERPGTHELSKTLSSGTMLAGSAWISHLRDAFFHNFLHRTNNFFSLDHIREDWSILLLKSWGFSSSTSHSPGLQGFQTACWTYPGEI
jgi:hypothetical protein